MTREPDRFDAQAMEIVDAVTDCMNGKTEHAECLSVADHVAAALRQAESSALERAAQTIRVLDLEHIGAFYGSAEGVRREILNRLEQGEAWRHPCACDKHRALIPPAAAPASDQDEVATFGAFGHGEPAAETGKAQSDEALRLLALVARKWTEAMTEIDASPLVVSIKEVARAAPPEGGGE